MCEDHQSASIPSRSSSPKNDEVRQIVGRELVRLLDRAKRLRETGEVGKAGSILGAIFKPLLAHPWAIELLYELVKSPAFDGEQIDRSLEEWIRRSSKPPVESPHDSQTGESEGIVSVTLARLHWRQGYRTEALTMYRELLQSNPGNTDLLQEYEKRLQEFHGRVDDRHCPLDVLESWAEKIRLRKTQLDRPTENDKDF